MQSYNAELDERRFFSMLIPKVMSHISYSGTEGFSIPPWKQGQISSSIAHDLHEDGKTVAYLLINHGGKKEFEKYEKEILRNNVDPRLYTSVMLNIADEDVAEGVTWLRGIDSSQKKIIDAVKKKFGKNKVDNLVGYEDWLGTGSALFAGMVQAGGIISAGDLIVKNAVYQHSTRDKRGAATSAIVRQKTAEYPFFGPEEDSGEPECWKREYLERFLREGCGKVPREETLSYEGFKSLDSEKIWEEEKEELYEIYKKTGLLELIPEKVPDYSVHLNEGETYLHVIAKEEFPKLRDLLKELEDYSMNLDPEKRKKLKKASLILSRVEEELYMPEFKVGVGNHSTSLHPNHEEKKEERMHKLLEHLLKEGIVEGNYAYN